MRKTIFKNAVLSLGIAFYSLATFAILPALAGTQNELKNGLKNEDRETFPGQRVGGGTRDGVCPRNAHQLIAINPSNNLSVTASEQPLIYIVLPKLDKLYPAEFLIEDTEGNIIYQMTLEVGQYREIRGFRLPKNLLKLDRNYTWSFDIFCLQERFNRDDNEPKTIAVWGALRQVLQEASLAPLENESTLDERLARVQSYQETGLWSDAIAALIELRQTHPNSDRVLAQWRQLLYALDFDKNEAVLEMLLEIQVPELQASE